MFPRQACELAHSILMRATSVLIPVRGQSVMSKSQLRIRHASRDKPVGIPRGPLSRASGPANKAEKPYKPGKGSGKTSCSTPAPLPEDHLHGCSASIVSPWPFGSPPPSGMGRLGKEAPLHMSKRLRGRLPCSVWTIFLTEVQSARLHVALWLPRTVQRGGFDGAVRASGETN